MGHVLLIELDVVDIYHYVFAHYLLLIIIKIKNKKEDKKRRNVHGILATELFYLEKKSLNMPYNEMDA